MIVKQKRCYLAPSNPLFSEDIVSQEVTINGHTHLMGEKKVVNISSSDFAESHFPNPKDYTLDNLIKSGAPLEEVPSPYLGGTPNNLEDTLGDVMNTLSNDDNFKDK